MRDLMRSRLAKNASWMFLGQGINFAVQACYFILLARLLGADQYGILVGAAAAVGLLSQYSMLGSGVVMLRQVSRQRSEFRQYWGNVLITTLSVGFLVILGLARFGKWMVGPASASVIVLVAVGECTCSRIAVAGGQAFQAFEQLKLTAVLTSLTNIARLATAACMVLVLRHCNACVNVSVIASLCVSCLPPLIATGAGNRHRLGWPRVNFRLLRERALRASVSPSPAKHYLGLQRHRQGHAQPLRHAGRKWDLQHGLSSHQHELHPYPRAPIRGVPVKFLSGLAGKGAARLHRFHRANCWAKLCPWACWRLRPCFWLRP